MSALGGIVTLSWLMEVDGEQKGTVERVNNAHEKMHSY
jgi:hypothetical protein